MAITMKSKGDTPTVKKDPNSDDILDFLLEGVVAGEVPEGVHIGSKGTEIVLLDVKSGSVANMKIHTDALGAIKNGTLGNFAKTMISEKVVKALALLGHNLDKADPNLKPKKVTPVKATSASDFLQGVKDKVATASTPGKQTPKGNGGINIGIKPLATVIELGQTVKGTDPGSLYTYVARSGDLKFAARYKSGKISIRVEAQDSLNWGPLFEKLKSASGFPDSGLSVKSAGGKASYVSGHYNCKGSAPLARKTLVAVLFGLGIPLTEFDSQVAAAVVS